MPVSLELELSSFGLRGRLTERWLSRQGSWGVPSVWLREQGASRG